MMKDMKPGSVIIDLAAEAGGNCEVTELDKVVDHKGVLVVGTGNLAGHVAVSASQLYARNLFNFLSPFADKDKGTVEIDWEDELVKGTLVTRDGAVVHPNLEDLKAKAGGATPAAKKPAEKKPQAETPKPAETTETAKPAAATPEPSSTDDEATVMPARPAAKPAADEEPPTEAPTKKPEGTDKP